MGPHFFLIIIGVFKRKKTWEFGTQGLDMAINSNHPCQESRYLDFGATENTDKELPKYKVSRDVGER